jgi:hypothetical protein
MHALAFGHETALRPSPAGKAGAGVGCGCQLTPFHRSADVVASTAVHAFGALHDTELAPPAEAGIVRTTHFLPFQRSARSVRTPELLAEYPPTAIQARRLAHDTDAKLLDVAPDGFGIGWIRHLVPFQCSANVISAPALLT